MRTPFNLAHQAPGELENLRQVVEAGQPAGDGTFTRRCERWIERKTGVKRALLTPSCTAALEMTALLLRAGPGDEIIVPSFTFVSTANAFALFGARPVFADITPDTLNLDLDHVRKLLTPRTKGVVVVHYAGIASRLDELVAFCGERGLPLIEDNAHGLGGAWRGRPLGSSGMAATLSFHESKNFSCGEGGALLLNSAELAARAEILREKGTNRSAFFRKEVAKYSWVDLGSSYLASEFQAAVLLAQFEDADRIQSRRRTLWLRYQDGLKEWSESTGVRLPTVPAEALPAWHLFYILLPDNESRERLIAHLSSDGFEAYFHYLPLHLSPMGRSFGGREGMCPVTESVAARLLRLPLYPALSDDKQEQIIESVRSFRP